MANLKSSSFSKHLKSEPSLLKSNLSPHLSQNSFQSKPKSLLSADVLIFGNQLESFILNRELKAHSMKTLLIPVESFPKLENYTWNPYENFSPLLDPEPIYKEKWSDFNKLKKSNSPPPKASKPNLLTQASERLHPLKNKSQSTLSEMQIYFDLLFKNIKLKENNPPFFALNRILKLHLRKHFLKSRTPSLGASEISSLLFKGGRLSSTLLTSGEKIEAPWVIFSFSPRLFVHWIKKSIKNKKDYPFPSRTFSSLAKFKAYNQITLVFTHRLKKGEKEKNGTLSEKMDKKNPESYKTFVLNHGKKFCGGFFGKPYQESENQILRKSCWMSLISLEEFENRKFLRKFILSMKKQIFNSFPHLFRKADLEEEVFLIEPESHGFLDFHFPSHFGLLKGAKNFLLSSSLFSSLPPPLNAFESAKKTLDSLFFLISNQKDPMN